MNHETTKEYLEKLDKDVNRFRKDLVAPCAEVHLIQWLDSTIRYAASLALYFEKTHTPKDPSSSP